MIVGWGLTNECLTGRGNVRMTEKQEEREEEEEATDSLSLLQQPVTPANAHFCDYATGARVLAANHKNDTGRWQNTNRSTCTLGERERGGAECRRARGTTRMQGKRRTEAMDLAFRLFVPCCMLFIRDLLPLKNKIKHTDPSCAQKYNF